MPSSPLPHVVQEPGHPCEYEYNLTPEDVSTLSDELFLARPPKYNTPFVCYRFDGESRYANLGRSLEQQIFNEAFPEHPHTPEEMSRQYGPYEGASTFLISFDASSKRPVGVVRIIGNSEAGLKTINDLLESDVTGGRAWTLDIPALLETYGIASLDDVQDIGTLGVLRQYRTSAMDISAQLYRALYLTITDEKEGVRHGVSIIDTKTLGQLKDYMGLPMQRIKGTQPFEYLGSFAEATYSRPEEYRAAVIRKRRLLKAAAMALRTMGGLSPTLERKERKVSTLIDILNRFIDGKDPSGVRDGSLQFETNLC